jgi:ABC-type uncharacterized transport system involved in gliding motility auxiliary subunit
MIQKILNIIGWVGTALVFAAVAARMLKPEWDQYAVYAAWTGLACVVLYTLGQWREILAYFKRRQARYGALATASVLVVLAIVVAVNYLSNRRNKRWDLTENQQYSLSEQSVKVLQNLDAPLKVIVFDRTTQFDRFRARLDEYAYHSTRVSVDYVDPDAKPVQARQYEVQTYGTVVLEYKDRKERVTTDNEQDITNALIKLVSGKERTIYFLQGHGEKDPTSTERDGYSAVADTLRRDNYKLERLALAQQKDVPEDATAVIIPGPTSDLLPQEIDALRRYLTRAGKLMVMVDPPIATQGGDFPNIEGLLKEWSITLGRNVVVDISGATNEPSLAVAIGYPSHPITERFNTLTIYPLARSVETVTGGTGGRNPQPVVETSQRSWAETSLATLSSGEGVAMEADKGDKPGPVTVAMAVSAAAEQPTPLDPNSKPEPDAPKPETRVLVFGDSDFPANSYGGIEGNRNLFANAVNWLSQQENLIAIRPKQADDRRITLTAGQQRSVMLMALLGIPVVVFGTGIYTWSRRRK